MALGASGDRPAALAQLMGILVNGGMRMPTSRVSALRFAEHTPYETRLSHRPAAGERVLDPEIARVARQALVDVVENGSGAVCGSAIARSSA